MYCLYLIYIYFDLASAGGYAAVQSAHATQEIFIFMKFIYSWIAYIQFIIILYLASAGGYSAVQLAHATHGIPVTAAATGPR